MTTIKLVRDRIPEIIRAAGGDPVTCTVTGRTYGRALRAKLREEVAEYLASGDPAELADVLEVVITLAAQHGIDPARLEAMRRAKAAERGGLAGGVVLFADTPAGTPPHPREDRP